MKIGIDVTTESQTFSITITEPSGPTSDHSTPIQHKCEDKCCPGYGEYDKCEPHSHHPDVEPLADWEKDLAARDCPATTQITRWARICYCRATDRPHVHVNTTDRLGHRVTIVWEKDLA